MVGLLVCSTLLMGKLLSADEFAAKRGEQVRQAIRKHGKCQDAALPVAYLENSDKCEQNETGEKVLQNGQAWLPQLMEKVPFLPFCPLNSPSIDSLDLCARTVELTFIC